MSFNGFSLHGKPGGLPELLYSGPPQLSKIHTLRVSVTERCNFRCQYCMPASGVQCTPHKELLTFEQLFENVEWIAKRTAIEHIRLTGGEPLVREGIHHMIAMLSSLPHSPEITMTTNGTLLARQVWALKAAGLRRVNVSLDTLNPMRFSHLTRGGRLENTVAGIDAALKAGLTPLKLNAVLLASSWQEDVPQLIQFAADRGVEVRFIELMRTGTEYEWCASEQVTVETVQDWLSGHAQFRCLTSSKSSPEARTLVNWKGRDVSVGWISPRSHPFCAFCDRLRIDARGQLRRCLMDGATLNLPMARSGGDLHAHNAFCKYLTGKHPPGAMEMEQSMCQIGG
ncbi:MAG: GTP 3',8-cyclase MoaA [Acidobacteriota bacterium]|nr:GTP 3',8-cyclase MoaA [Acidobacteriota bacterium]